MIPLVVWAASCNSFLTSICKVCPSHAGCRSLSSTRNLVEARPGTRTTGLPWHSAIFRPWKAFWRACWSRYLRGSTGCKGDGGLEAVSMSGDSRYPPRYPGVTNGPKTASRGKGNKTHAHTNSGGRDARGPVIGLLEVPCVVEGLFAVDFRPPGTPCRHIRPRHTTLRVLGQSFHVGQPLVDHRARLFPKRGPRLVRYVACNHPHGFHGVRRIQIWMQLMV